MVDESPASRVVCEPVSLREIALVFLKLGTTTFGGPAAHIAMMQDVFVRRRKWLSDNEFLDRVAAANLIPGPSSTEVAIFIGQFKRGWPGLLIAGTCFIVPATFLVILLAAAYVRYGSLPQVAGILYGIKPAVVAIILQALWSLSRSAIKTWRLGAIATVALALTIYGFSPLPVLALAAVAGAISVVRFKPRLAIVAIPAPMNLLSQIAPALPAIPISLARLFLSFLKIGAMVFGSGYVLLAFLRSEFIDHLHWLTEKQLLDAVAVGQFTPGPVFTTATFIGYLVAGVSGACVATLGIFLPGFVFVAVFGPLLPRLRSSVTLSATLDGVVAASLALMASVVWQLGKAAVQDWPAALILATSTLLVMRFRMNSALVIGAAAIAGWLLR